MADIKAITDKLEQGVQDVWNSDAYIKYLNVMSRFHRYSFRNCVLIMMQKPDASLVAGYKAWQTNFKRNVKRGEKGIQILAPCPRKKTVVNDYGEEEEKQFITYKAATVFDVSQTEGEDLPTYGVGELHGDVKDYKVLMDKLQGLASVPVNTKEIDGSAKGYCSKTEIALKAGMSELQTLKTMVHELAHHLLKHSETEGDADTKEIEAESVAYVVCQTLGLETAEYSFSYVAGWASSKGIKELQSVLNVIQKTANTIIEGVNMIHNDTL